MTARPTLASALVDEAAGMATLGIDDHLLILDIQDAVMLARRFPGARCGAAKLGGSPGTQRIRIPVLRYSGHTIRLARALVGAAAGERVRYKQGGPWDLRRSNLLLWPPRVAAAQVPAG